MLKLILAILLYTIALPAMPMAQTENDFNDSLCSMIGGERETRHNYSYDSATRLSHVYVDCETANYVIEGGLDKRSSLDSLQQALFFSVLTGKAPAVVIYDTNGEADRYEHRIRAASEKAGVLYLGLDMKNTQDRERLIAVFEGTQ